MCVQSSSQRRLLRWGCALGVGALYTVIITYVSSNGSSVYKRPPIRPYFYSTPAKTSVSYSHLQPLKDMFANLTVKPSGLHKSDCMLPAAKFSDLKEPENKEKVLLLVIVSTAPSRQDRRTAIRETWWKNEHEVACKFFTDGLQVSKEEQAMVLKEKQIYKDIEFQPIVGGRTFGLRYLYHIMWATAKYDFTYLLRIDDDYFVCIERLLHELHNRPHERLVWGSYHCAYRDLIYMDEAWTLFTHDVITRILSQDPLKIQCHPHADQEIPVWLDGVFSKDDSLTHFDDRRLHHYPPAKVVDKFKSVTHVCDSYMGVHGSTPEQMRRFLNYSNDGPKEVPTLTDISKTCSMPIVFNVSLMGGPYKFDLRPCIQNPQWTPHETMWLGIQQGGRRAKAPC